MSKRRAEHQLTDRDDPDDFVGDEAGEYAVASAEVMATRKIVKAKRRTGGAVPVNQPVEPTPTAVDASVTEKTPEASSAASSAWPTFSFTSTTPTDTPASPASSATSSSWPTFSFKSDSTPTTPSAATSGWPTFSFKSESTPTKTEEGAAAKPFSFSAPTFSLSSSTDSEKKEETPASASASAPAPANLFAWPTFTFAPSSTSAAPSSESPSKASSSAISWPSLSNPLAPATETTEGGFPSVHFDLTKLGEGKQEALSLTNANKGILGVNIAPPKTPSDTATTASSFSTVASPTKLAKLEDMKTGEEEEETEFKARSKIYQWTNDSWTERGVGLLKSNFNNEKGSTRLIMRGDTTGRLLLNFPIFAQMILAKQSTKAVRIVGFNHTGEVAEPKPEQYLLRFMSEDDATQCEGAIKMAIARAPATKVEEKAEEKAEEKPEEKPEEEKAEEEKANDKPEEKDVASKTEETNTTTETEAK